MDGRSRSDRLRASDLVKRVRRTGPPEPCALGGMLVSMTSESSSAPVESTQVTAVTDGVAQVFTWEADARIEVRGLGGEVVIEANAAGLRTLAGHLLALAGEGVSDGSHLHLEDSNGLEDGSLGLVLERCDDE